MREKDEQIIAIPSVNPGGLNAGLGAHFGHCDLYTLVTVEDGRVVDVEVLRNVPHQRGGCMTPVRHLAGNGVNQLIAGGMGLRSLMEFSQVGIEVYCGGGARTVRQAVEAMLSGQLPKCDQEHTCGGGQKATNRMSFREEMPC